MKWGKIFAIKQEHKSSKWMKQWYSFSLERVHRIKKEESAALVWRMHHEHIPIIVIRLGIFWDRLEFVRIYWSKAGIAVLYHSCNPVGLVLILPYRIQRRCSIALILNDFIWVLLDRRFFKFFFNFLFARFRRLFRKYWLESMLTYILLFPF
jgi:hypothetical protein